MYLTGHFLLVMGNIMGRNLGFIMLSNVIGPYMSGAYMGWGLAIGTIVSLLGPLWGAFAIEISLKLCFGLMVFLLIGMASCVMVVWRHCDVHSYFKKEL